MAAYQCRNGERVGILQPCPCAASARWRGVFIAAIMPVSALSWDFEVRSSPGGAAKSGRSGSERVRGALPCNGVLCANVCLDGEVDFILKCGRPRPEHVSNPSDPTTEPLPTMLASRQNESG